MPDKRVVVITGSRKGIGRALAEHFASAGHEVVGCSRTEPDWSLPNYHHHVLDVSDEDAVRKMFSDIRKSHGRLDVLINNAGIASMNHALLQPVSTVRNIMETNVTGTFLFCREAARLMSKTRSGRIVNFSTVAVALDLEGEAIYAASKAAVESLTRILARELAHLGITVNAIGPTPVRTDLIRNVPQQKLEEVVARQAIKRFGELRDVINVVEFFISPQSDFVTGQVVYLGGV